MTDRTIVLDPSNPIPFRVFDNDDGTFSLAIHDPLGGVKTQTATVTIDADSSFTVEHIFDLGYPTTFFVLATLLSINPDGETTGQLEGNIAVPMSVVESRDGVLTSLFALSHTSLESMVATNDTFDTWSVTPRYVHVTLILGDGYLAAPYVGSNDPSAEVRLDIEYTA